MDDQLTHEEQQKLWNGFMLFAATNILVLKGGDHPGPHLGLLSVYFPGYRVTFLGSIIGFVYAFVMCYALGRLIVTIYNRLISEPQ